MTPPTLATAPATSDNTAVRALELLSDLARGIALASEDLQQSLEKLLAETARETRADAVALWTTDAGSDYLGIRNSYGVSPRLIRYFNHTDRMRLGKGAIGSAAVEGTTARIEEQGAWGTLGPLRWVELFREEGAISMLIVPMRAGNRPIGALTVLHKSPHRYAADERLFFEALGSEVAVALVNDANYRATEENKDRLAEQIAKLTHLQDSFQSINRYLGESVDDALAFLARYVQETFRGQAVAIFEPSPDGRGLTLSGESGLPERYKKHMLGTVIPLVEAESLIQQAYAEKKPLISERVFTDERIGKRWSRILSDDLLTTEAVFPLLVETRALGVLVVYHDHLHHYTDEEASVLGAFSQFFGILFDNRKIFSSLVSEKRKTQSIVYSLRDGLVAYDLTGRAEDANPRALEMLGATRGEIIGALPSAEESPAVALQNFYALSSLEVPDYETRTLMLTRPRALTLEVTQVPLFEEDRAKRGSLRIIHDITDERRVELLKANFVSTATHQLRTPLTGIRWGLESVIQDSPELPEKARGLLGQVLKTTEFIISLVNDLLTVSQTEEGSQRYAFVRLRIDTLLRSVAEEASLPLKNKRISFSLALPAQLPEVMVDKSMMTVALQNIVDNAVRYTPEGGSVSVTVSPSASTLAIEVKDSGIGISKDDLPLLFNKFFRAKNAVRMETAGSGLGLFLAKQIVERHNGRLTVDSTLGKGTTFTIQLPLDASQMPKSESVGTSTPTQSKAGYTLSSQASASKPLP